MVTPPEGLNTFIKSSAITGQLRAARVFTGMTQRDLASALAVTERAVRFWERKHDRRPTSAPNDARIEQALLTRGVAAPTFSSIKSVGLLPSGASYLPECRQSIGEEPNRLAGEPMLFGNRCSAVPPDEQG